MLLPPESRNRVQKAAIVPLTVLQPALKQFGRTDATVAILLACGKLDKQWRMAIEDEANAAEGLVDLELTEDLAAERALELCDELGEWDLAHELLTAELRRSNLDRDPERDQSGGAQCPEGPDCRARLWPRRPMSYAPASWQCRTGHI